jgi:pentatricopeptide repeat protein
MQERAPTKKQRKRHNRQLKESRHNVDKHGEPGSKAGERREWVKQWKEDMLHPVQELPLEELEKYTIDDALLDDLMGNTKDAQPTPEPKYLGHLQHKFFNRIADQMDDHRRKTELLATGDTPMSEETSVELLDLQDAELPTDRDLSLALRAFRDREGTRKKPVGIVKALKHLLQDAGVPVTAFGELAYTSLLTCAQSPVEGRRIIQMMKQRQHPVSDYSWSIMVDIHAKVGDYKGCLDVHKEMIAEGLRPTMASFTSLLAACYKVCSDGRISHKMRSDAANVAWDQWQEMRVVGVSPDVMAYGAILRIMAARGKPERALNLLEELQMNSIAPTTLCFTSALRAVARSHSTAIRYEHGSTRRNSRREFITAHHGKLAQSIVRLAESAEVEQDDGFIAALISCASAAGDLATAKAIYVGHQVRQLDSFRTIGSNEHLARLRGESTDELEQLEGSPDLISDGSSQPVKTGQNSAVTKRLASEKREKTMSFGEREYGKDSRILSAIMQACANAAGKNMIGTQWQGRENEGYLCENSIRLLNTRGIPEYTDVSIPGAGRTDSLTWAGDEKDIDRRGDKRMSGKFTGVYEDDSVPSTLDELDDMFSRYFVDEDGRRKPEFQQTTPRDIWNKRYGLQSGINDGYGAPLLEKGTPELQALPDSTPQQVAPMHFNKDTMRWEAGPAEVPERAQSAVRYPPSKIHETPSSGNGDTNEELYFDDNTMRWKTRPTIHRVELIDHVAPGPLEHHSRQERNDIPEELFFDKDEMRWRTMTFTEVEDMKRTDFEKKLLSEGRNDVQVRENPVCTAIVSTLPVSVATCRFSIRLLDRLWLDDQCTEGTRIVFSALR